MPQTNNPVDRKPQFSLRQLWLVVSLCGVLFAIPFFVLLLLWLFLSFGLGAAVLIFLILLQAPAFFLFKTLASHRGDASETEDPRSF